MLRPDNAAHHEVPRPPPLLGRLWRNQDFMLVWFGQAASGLGTAISGVLLPLIAVVYLRADAFAVGALAAAAWAPWLLIGLPAGAWVDRAWCRPLMVGCDLVRAVAIASVPITTALGLLSLGQLFAVAAVKGVAKVLFQIAYQPYLPSLVGTEDLTEANAKLQGTGAVAAIVGPGVGGVLAQLVRAPIAIIADAASYLASVYSLLRIRSRETVRAPLERKVWGAIIEGARYVRRDALLPALTIAPAVANFFFTGFDAIAVVFLVRSVHLSQAAVGLLLTATGLGSVIGAVLARHIGRWIGTSRALWLVALTTAPFGLLIPLTTPGAGLIFFMVGEVVVFAGTLVYNVIAGAFRQTYCPPLLLGRVVATMRFVAYGAVPLGALAGGALASVIGNRPAILALLVGNLIPGLILAASPLRPIRDLPDRPPVEASPEHQ